VAVDEVIGDGGREPALPWSVAWERAAYGPLGFYSEGAGAVLGTSRFFRTSVHVGPVFHRAIATLLVEVDERLEHPAVLDLVDVGAGRGELLVGVLASLPQEVAARVRARAVDVHARPADLDPRVGWITGVAPAAVPHALRGLVVANEWLDDVPLDVVEVNDDGALRLVLVETDGTEHLGPSIDDDDAWRAWGLDATAARAWLDLAWPLEHPGDRGELGHPRDAAWAEVVSRLDAGTALAVDYRHPAGWDAGTLCGYREAGRAVRPVPDGSLNLTAHVSTGSVAAAVGATVTRQREALLALGVSAVRPSRDRASDDPIGYALALQDASDASELLDLTGLGDFRWIRVDR
jgi:SAM-dependent MidA family methyltransferase